MSKYDINSQGANTSSFVQQASISNSDLASTNSQIASDPTVLPTSSDGTLWKTLSITPVSTDNYLLIEGTISVLSANASGSQIAIFDGISSNAIGTFYQATLSSANITNIPFRFIYSPASTAAFTFSLRYGVYQASAGQVMIINGYLQALTPTQIGAGVCYSTWTITEISP